MSFVSSDRCCRDNGGGGDRSDMPGGIDSAGIPADFSPPCLGGDCGLIIGMFPVIGLCILLAVIGVLPAGVSIVATDEVEGVEPLYQVSDTLPSLLRDLGAGGARYDLRLCLSIIEIAQSSRSTGVRFAACTKLSRS